MDTKDASEKEKVAAVPTIITDSFDTKSRIASIQLQKGKSKVIESYALIKVVDPAVDKNGKKAKGKLSTTYIKAPVVPAKNELYFTFNVPKEAQEYLFKEIKRQIK